MDGIVTIVLTIIVFVGIIALCYVLVYNNLQAYKIKINEAESMIDEILRKKYDLLLALKKIIINQTDIDLKTLEGLENLKEQNLSSFAFERKLADFNDLFKQIKQDYNKLDSDDNFNESSEEIYNLNEKLEAAKIFYNKYTSFLNKLIKKFPSNIIAKFHQISVQTYFDGKNLFDEEINDFKV